MIAAAREPLRARRNTPFVYAFQVRRNDAPLDLTGHTATMQVRLYGMAPEDPQIDLETVSVLMTEGLTIIGSTVSAFIDELTLMLMPSAHVAQRDDRFAYDLVISDPDGYSWVERWGPFDLAQGVTGEDATLIATIDGRILTTIAGDYLGTANG